MSTRGYITIIDDKKNVVAACYSGSDSYLDGLGLDVLDAFENHNMEEFISDLLKSFPEDLDMVEGIQRSWYVKTSKNKDDFFQDYCYEWDSNKDCLNIYYFGTPALTVEREDIDLYRYIFQNENALYYPLTLDEKTMTLKKDYYKELRAIAQGEHAKERLEDIIKNNSSVLYMDIGCIADYGPFDLDRYLKRVSDSASFGKGLLFGISKAYGNRYHVTLQTPFYRKTLKDNLGSKGACEKYIASLIRERPNDLRGTMKLFQNTEKIKKELSRILEDDSKPLEERLDTAGIIKNQFIKEIEDLRLSHSFNPLGLSFDSMKKEIQLNFSNTYYAVKWREEEKRQKEKSASFNTIVEKAEQKVEKETRHIKVNDSLSL